MRIYLDNCASTRPYTKVIEKMSEVMTSNYANSSALHGYGFESERLINESRNIIANSLGVDEKEIIFTSGATEGINMAIRGACKASKRWGKHIISTNIEHAATRRVLDILENEYGYEVTYLKVDKNGIIDLEELKSSLKDTTFLVTIMSVNNEVGSILPVNEAAIIVKEFNKHILFHVDAVQGFLKQRYDTEVIDMITVSSHKLHGPKGIGFLFKKKGINIAPLIVGGSHQSNMRAGTMATELIVGFGEAVRIGELHVKESLEHFRLLKNRFIEGLSEIDNVRINCDLEKCSPHVCSVVFSGIRSEVLLHALEDEEVYASAGSSCSSHSKKASSVLINIGLSEEEADATLRFSFSIFNTIEEIDRCIEALKKLVPLIRRFVRR